MQRWKCHKEVSAFRITRIDCDEMPKFLRPTCRGCYAFGSACGRCERCAWELSGERLGYRLASESELVSVTKDYMAKHKPVIGGYFVLYDDGYQSFSPAKAFEEGYAPVA